jgi:hypothetical protein
VGLSCADGYVGTPIAEACDKHNEPYALCEIGHSKGSFCHPIILNTHGGASPEEMHIKIYTGEVSKASNASPVFEWNPPDVKSSNPQTEFAISLDSELQINQNGVTKFINFFTPKTTNCYTGILTFEISDSSWTGGHLNVTAKDNIYLDKVDVPFKHNKLYHVVSIDNRDCEEGCSNKCKRPSAINYDFSDVNEHQLHISGFSVTGVKCAIGYFGNAEAFVCSGNSRYYKLKGCIVSDKMEHAFLITKVPTKAVEDAKIDIQNSIATIFNLDFNQNQYVVITNITGTENTNTSGSNATGSNQETSETGSSGTGPESTGATGTSSNTGSSGGSNENNSTSTTEAASTGATGTSGTTSGSTGATGATSATGSQNTAESVFDQSPHRLLLTNKDRIHYIFQKVIESQHAATIKSNGPTDMVNDFYARDTEFTGNIGNDIQKYAKNGIPDLNNGRATSPIGSRHSNIETKDDDGKPLWAEELQEEITNLFKRAPANITLPSVLAATCKSYLSQFSSNFHYVKLKAAFDFMHYFELPYTISDGTLLAQHRFNLFASPWDDGIDITAPLDVAEKIFKIRNQKNRYTDISKEKAGIFIYHKYCRWRAHLNVCFKIRVIKLEQNDGDCLSFEALNWA